MLCAFQPTDEINDAGERRFCCTRCGYVSVFIPDMGQPIYRNCQNDDGTRPGDALAALLKEVGIEATDECGCVAAAAQMNQWGAEGCRANRATIAGWLQSAALNHKWKDTLIVAMVLRKQKWFNALHPFASIVDEAIQRSIARLSADSSPQTSELGSPR